MRSINEEILYETTFLSTIPASCQRAAALDVVLLSRSSNTTATAASLPSCLQTRESVRLSLCQIELRIDSLGGLLLGRLEVPATGGWEQWQTLNKMFGK